MQISQRQKIWQGFVAVITVTLLSVTANAAPTREEFMEIAQKGWVFELRSSVLRRDASMPPIRLNGKQIVNGSICMIGDEPHALTRTVIAGFEKLIGDIFGRTERIRSGGGDVEGCGSIQRTYIRLYSGAPPHREYNDDLRRLDAAYEIGLPNDRDQIIQSPAQANAFFGRKGMSVHLLVKQPATSMPSRLEREFYTSILIEELFQVFSFGMDILEFDRKEPFRSKLQEYPINLRVLPWGSEKYMEGLVNANPKGLCAFDVFMLHALANSELDTTNSQEFLTYVGQRFDDLAIRAQATLARPEFAALLDPNCAELPE